MRSVERMHNHKFENIYLETDFENSNPGSGGVEIDHEGVFVLRQKLEDGAARGYSFHFHVAIANDNPSPKRIPLRILWADRDFDFCRDYMYVGYDSGQEWRMLSLPCKDGISEFEIVLPKGRHLLCCTPKFDYSDYLALLEKCGDEEFCKIVDVAKTPEDRIISCFKLGSETGKRIVVTTRAHGYETSGAHCLRGLLRKIKECPENYSEVLENFQLYLFPMLNPDAVVAGNCCVSTSGVNFGKDLGVSESHKKDCAAKTLTEFFLKLQPDYYLDMHNNTGPHLSDSFRSHNSDILEHFAKAAPDMSRQQKVWNIYQKEWESGRPMVKCHQEFGTIYMVTEFPWYTRLPEEMEEFGILFFDALFNALKGENRC